MQIFVLGSYVNANCLRVECLPVPGESLVATALWREHGGKGFNLAVALHRLGVQVDLLVAVGEDAAAEALLQFLQRENLSCQGVVKLAGASGFGVGFVAPNGENFLAVYPGANALLNAAHVAQAIDGIKAAKLVCAQFEISDEPILATFRVARQQGIVTFLNPSPWRSLSHELLSLTDILVLNASEAAGLCKQSLSTVLSVNQWRQLLPEWAKAGGWQGQLLVVTLGTQGCVALYQGEVVYQPAFVITAIDTTGAGDAFSAGLAAAWVQNLGLAKALQYACACGAWVATQQGVLSCLPSHELVCGLLDTNKMPLSAGNSDANN